MSERVRARETQTEVNQSGTLTDRQMGELHEGQP